MITRRSLVFFGAGALTGAAALPAFAQQPATGDWPQWRGPDRTGHSRETGLLKSWPAAGPRLLWKSTGRGPGFATPCATGGRVFGMGNRNGAEVVWALRADTGQELWATPFARAGRVDRGDGPRSTPTIDGNRVYALGVTGELVCLDLATGRLLWQKSLVRDFGGSIPTWGYTESPLVDGDRVIVTPGQRAHTMVALNKSNGATVWSCQVPGGDGAQYSSVISADLGGRRQYIQFLARGVVGVSSDGRFLWRYANPANDVANCSTPIYRDGHVFAASNYGVGGGLARIAGAPAGGDAPEVYFTKRMQNHHGGVILVGDYLYGFDGSNLTCLDFKTGQVKWFDRSVGKGSVSYADGHLYCRSESGGQVALVEATPARYMEKARFRQPDLSGQFTWPHPVIANGRLYLRDQEVLLCYDVKGA